MRAKPAQPYRWLNWQRVHLDKQLRYELRPGLLYSGTIEALISTAHAAGELMAAAQWQPPGIIVLPLPGGVVSGEAAAFSGRAAFLAVAARDAGVQHVRLPLVSTLYKTSPLMA